MGKTLKNKVKSQMEVLTQGYEDFIKGQELKKGGKKLFDKVIKKAIKSKQHGSK
jgi:hypothetical protein